MYDLSLTLKSRYIGSAKRYLLYVQCTTTWLRGKHSDYRLRISRHKQYRLHIMLITRRQLNLKYIAVWVWSQFLAWHRRLQCIARNKKNKFYTSTNQRCAPYNTVSNEARSPREHTIVKLIQKIYTTRPRRPIIIIITGYNKKTFTKLNALGYT